MLSKTTSNISHKICTEVKLSYTDQNTSNMQKSSDYLWNDQINELVLRIICNMSCDFEMTLDSVAVSVVFLVFYDIIAIKNSDSRQDIFNDLFSQ